jgi:hypothetical protein
MDNVARYQERGMLEASRKASGDFAPAGLEVAQMGKWSEGFRVAQVFDKENMLAGMGQKTVWLKGFPTKDLADGSTFKPAAWLKVASTKQYTDTQGAVRTVFVIEQATAEMQKQDKNDRGVPEGIGPYAGKGELVKFESYQAKRSVMIAVNSSGKRRTYNVASAKPHVGGKRAEWKSLVPGQPVQIWTSPDGREIIAVDGKATPKTVRPEMTEANTEAAAANKLKLIKELLDAGRTDVARLRLERFDKDYPHTRAATEAKKLLDRL